MLQAVTNLMNEFLPKMHKGNQKEFQMVLKGDADVQAVIQSYSEKIQGWIQKLQRTRRSRRPTCTPVIAYLDEKHASASSRWTSSSRPACR